MISMPLQAPQRLREDLDHIDFKAESIKRIKEDLGALVVSALESAAVNSSGNGKKMSKTFGCGLGQHFDGIFIDTRENLSIRQQSAGWALLRRFEIC